MCQDLQSSLDAQQLMWCASLWLTRQCGMQEEPVLFQQLLHKTEGQRSDWEYPFAVAGINLTFMLQEVVGLRDRHVGTLVTDLLPASAPAQAFLGLLQQAQDAFEQVGSQDVLAASCMGRWSHQGARARDGSPGACAVTA